MSAGTTLVTAVALPEDTVTQLVDKVIHDCMVTGIIASFTITNFSQEKICSIFVQDEGYSVATPIDIVSITFTDQSAINDNKVISKPLNEGALVPATFDVIFDFMCPSEVKLACYLYFTG